MQFILGLLTAVVFFILLAGAYWLGTKYKKRSVARTADKDTQQRIEKQRKEFMNLMNYDVSKALERKKVT